MFGLFGPKVPQVNGAELEQRLKSAQAPVLVDVREPNEYAQGHIPGTRLIPLGTLPKRLQELPADAEIVMICRSGARSQAAAQQALAAGYKAANLVGGMIGWRGPVER